jgi:hypothetical protein
MRKHASELPVEDPRRVDRVRDRTPAHVLAKIDRETATRVFAAARQGPEAIAKRIADLDKEWDLERYLALNFTVVMAATEELGRRGNRVAMGVFRAQQVFLGIHALFGWCPPTAVLRRLGVRTQKEIDAERGVLVELHRLFGEAEADGEPIEIVEEIEVVYDPATDTSAGTPLRW